MGTRNRLHHELTRDEIAKNYKKDELHIKNMLSSAGINLGDNVYIIFANDEDYKGTYVGIGSFDDEQGGGLALLVTDDSFEAFEKQVRAYEDPRTSGLQNPVDYAIHIDTLTIKEIKKIE